MNLPATKKPSELLRRGYSEEEITHLYALGKLFLEAGDFPKSELVFRGITEVAPEFAPAWLGLVCINLYNDKLDEAVFLARQAVRVDPNSVESLLLLITCLLSTEDYNSAGTYLGEIGELIDSKEINSPNLIRFYKAQLIRYGQRGVR